MKQLSKLKPSGESSATFKLILLLMKVSELLRILSKNKKEEKRSYRSKQYNDFYKNKYRNIFCRGFYNNIAVY